MPSASQAPAAHWALVTLAPCALALAAHGQTVARDLQWAEHERAVRAERSALLRDAFRSAGSVAQLDARLAFAARRSSGAAALAPAPLRTVAYVTGELIGVLDEDDELSPAERAWWIAQSLDLRPRPGLFAARTEGLGEPTTVAVTPLWPIEFEGDAVVELHWVDAAGERVLARREPFAASAFLAGFEMAVRPPASSAGAWKLEPVVEFAGQRGRGVGVGVPCITEPVERARRAAEALAEDGAAWTAAVRRALASIVSRNDHGRRDELYDPADAFALLAAWSQREPAADWPAGLLRPWDPGSESVAEAYAFEPSLSDDQRIRRVVAVVVSSHEAAGEPWLGTGGGLLRRWATECEARVVTLRLSPGWDPPATPVVEALRALAEGGELVLVARGDAAGRLPAAEPDALVLCSYYSAAPPQLTLERPVLFVTPLGDGAHRAWGVGDVGPNVTWIEGEREPSLSWVPLHDALATWLRER